MSLGDRSTEKYPKQNSFGYEKLKSPADRTVNVGRADES